MKLADVLTEYVLASDHDAAIAALEAELALEKRQNAALIAGCENDTKRIADLEAQLVAMRTEYGTYRVISDDEDSANVKRIAELEARCERLRGAIQRECDRQGCWCLEGTEHLHECSFCQLRAALAQAKGGEGR